LGETGKHLSHRHQGVDIVQHLVHRLRQLPDIEPELQPVVTKVRVYEKAIAELADLETLLEDRSVDREMRDLAELEMPEVKEQIE
ncbi:hypothetical protein ACC739_37295, partial [Rhizobium ruizarguesonis]